MLSPPMVHRALCLCLLAIALNTACTSDKPVPADPKGAPATSGVPGDQPAAPTSATPAEPTAKLADFPGLKWEIVKPGSGEELRYGQKIKVHYVGTLVNGKQFDSSRDRGEPAEFELVEGGLIKGWTLGLPGMKVGERRRLSIPSEAGYGPQGQGGSIPPDSTLIFDVELLEIVKPAANKQ